MRIAIDLRCAHTGSRHRGIGRYALSLVTHLLDLVPGGAWVLLEQRGGESTTVARSALGAKARIVEFSTPQPDGRLLPDPEWRSEAAMALREALLDEIAPDVVLETSPFETQVASRIHPPGERSYLSAAVVYDLIPLFLPEHYLPEPSLRDWYVRKLAELRNADCFLCLSQHTLEDLVQKLAIPRGRCANILGAPIPARFPGNGPPPGAASQDYESPGAILYAGGFDPRKNVEQLVRAFALLSGELQCKHPLVLAGACAEAKIGELRELARSLGAPCEQLRFPGYVSGETLARLYESCGVFVYPSIYEGLGLPPLEAMALGAPVLTAARTSLLETAASPHALFDPKDDAQLAGLIERTLLDDTFREDLISLGRQRARDFSWERTARAAFEMLSAQLADRPADRRARTGRSESFEAAAIRRVAGIRASSGFTDEDLLIVSQCIAENGRQFPERRERRAIRR